MAHVRQGSGAGLRGSRCAPPALLAIALLSACAGGSPRATTAPSPAADARYFDTRSRQFVNFGAMVDAAAGAEVVFFGEYHDDATAHVVEAALLAAVGERREKVVLSLEMFERDVQVSLDRWLRGDLSDSAFLAVSRPWPRYATDYRPLVEVARRKGWPVIASNVPRPIASAVGRSGLPVLDTLGTRRDLVAAAISCPEDEYYRRFLAAMPSHDAGTGGQATDAAAKRAANDRFYLAQCIKDETMAESIQRAAVAFGSGSLVIHYNGAFHSDFRDGTASRVARRMPAARLLVISAVPVADLAAADGVAHAARADFIVFTLRPAAAGARPADAR
ncbi:MAG: ChaN family lipoprotein [Gemmatimonadota bacterium]